MSLGSLALAIWLVLVGITWLGWVAISTKFLGGWAALTGLLLFLEAYHPITVWRRPAA